MERHQRHLEGETRRQEDEAEHDADRLMALKRLADADERNGAGEAVDQRRPIEKHAGRERAEHEIFEARLGGLRVVAVEGRDDVEREAHQLETQIERDQVAGRDQHQHPERRQHNQHRELELVDPLFAQEGDGHHERHERADERQRLHEAAEIVGHDRAVEAEDRVSLMGVADREQCEGQHRDGEAGHELGCLLAAEGADAQKRERADREDQIGDELSEGIADGHVRVSVLRRRCGRARGLDRHLRCRSRQHRHHVVDRGLRRVEDRLRVEAVIEG